MSGYQWLTRCSIYQDFVIRIQPLFKKMIETQICLMIQTSKEHKVKDLVPINKTNILAHQGLHFQAFADTCKKNVKIHFFEERGRQRLLTYLLTRHHASMNEILKMKNPQYSFFCICFKYLLQNYPASASACVLLLQLCPILCILKQ